MRSVIRLTVVPCCALAAVFALVGARPAAAATSAPVPMANRQNVNILNSDTVVISAEQTAGIMQPPSGLIGSMDTGAWDGGSNQPGGDNTLTISLNAVRNLHRIELNSGWGGAYSVNEALIETSSDGLVWTPQPHSVSLPDATHTIFTLDSAVDASFLRLTGTQYDDAAQRWIISQMRVFGSPGSFAADQHLDLVAGGSFIGGVTLATTGMNITDTTLSEFVDDAQSLIKRKVLYNIGTGDSLTLTFGSPFNMERFGFMAEPTLDSTMQFRVETSMDGLGWTTVLTQNGGIVRHANFFDLSPSVGQYLRFTALTVTGTTDSRLGDVFVFGSILVPEPSVLALLAVGVLGIPRRPRERRPATRRSA